KYPFNPSERNEPGDTVFTRIPSDARPSDRFFDRLVIADFAAVYAMRDGDCRFVECADTFTMRAHSASRNNGNAARMQRTADIAPMSKVAIHSSSSSASKPLTPTSTGPAAFTSTLIPPSHREPTTSKAAITDEGTVKSVDTPYASGAPASSNASTV